MTLIKPTHAAVAVAQVNTYTFAGTWTIGDIITVTYGGASYDYAITSATIATFIPLLQAALAALGAGTYPQFYEQVYTDTSTTVILTARTAGKPFTCTISTNSSGGYVTNGSGTTTTTTGAATTASQGP